MKMWYICIMEYYSAAKNEVMKIAGKHMGLGKRDYWESEVTQTQEEKWHMFYLIGGS